MQSVTMTKFKNRSPLYTTRGADLPHVAKKEEHHEGALKRKAVGADNGPLE